MKDPEPSPTAQAWDRDDYTHSMANLNKSKLNYQHDFGVWKGTKLLGGNLSTTGRPYKLHAAYMTIPLLIYCQKYITRVIVLFRSLW